MSELLQTLLQAVITIATPIVAAFAVQFLRANAEHAKNKIKNERAQRYLNEVVEAASTAVMKTAQTYTDQLKKNHEFNSKEHEIALKMAIEEAKSLLSADASRFIEEVYGDVSKYIAAQIEAAVKMLPRNA